MRGDITLPYAVTTFHVLTGNKAYIKLGKRVCALESGSYKRQSY